MIAQLFMHLRRPSPSKAARELSLEGHRQRKLNERERKLAVARRLREEVGLAPDPRLA